MIPIQKEMANVEMCKSEVRNKDTVNLHQRED